MSYKNIKAVFDEVCSELVIDEKLIKRLNDYHTKFINRNADHIEFFGGNLLGVQVIRFAPNDRNEWFNDILQVDEYDLEDKLYSLPDVNPEFQVSSDVMNLSCLWLSYAFLRNTKLSIKQKEEARFTIMMILNIKLLTSLMFHYFKYPADREKAAATYAELSYKYAIKQEGSWYKVLEKRSEDILHDNSIHAKALTKFDNDVSIIYMINDIQGRLRNMVKNIYSVFMRIHEQDVRISTSSALIEHDGTEVLKDKTKSLQTYTRYLLDILADANTLVKDDLVNVVTKQIKTMPEKLLRQTLEWLTNNSGSGKHAPLIEESVNLLMIHAFNYLQGNKVLLRNTADMSTLLTKLKGTYMSSRNTDAELKQLRSNFEKIAKLATENKNSTVISSVRTGTMLYLVIRAISMRHYANNG